MSGFNRNTYQSRIWRAIARQWNIPYEEVGELDPVIRMLVDAMNAGLEENSFEHQASQKRLIQQLASLMLPNQSLRPSPAHSLMTAVPNREDVFTNKEDQVVFPIDKEGSMTPVDFTPVGSFKLWKGHIACVVQGANIRSASGAPISEKGQESSLSICLGIDIENTKETLENLSIRVSFDQGTNNTTPNLERYFPYIKCFTHQGEEIYIKQGFNTDSIRQELQIESADAYKPLSDLTNPISSLENQVLQFYAKQFITVDQVFFEKRNYPEKFALLFTAEELQHFFKKELFWIELQFPYGFPPSYLRSTNYQLNCFPVLNRKKYTLDKQFKAELPIFPINAHLEDKQMFFAIEKVVQEKELDHSIIQDEDNIPIGSYSIRQGGIQRFSEVDAIDLIRQLKRRLKTDTLAFETLGSSSLLPILENLEKAISALPEEAESIFTKEHVPYLMVNSSDLEKDKESYVHVHYWTTQGQVPKELSLKEKPLQVSANEWVRTSVKLLTKPVGGNCTPESEKLESMFRSELLSRGRITTFQDIYSFAKKKLWGFSSEMKLSYAIENYPDGRRNRILLLTVVSKLEENETLARCKLLEVELNERSGAFTPIRVQLSSQHLSHISLIKSV